MSTIAVGVTVRDDRDGLVLLLDALAKQTRLPDEVVIIDAASTDGTREAAEAFARTAPFPVLVESRPCTRGAARARIIEAAATDLVAFTDADCVPPPGWLERYDALWKDRAPRTVALGGPNASAPGANPLQDAVDDVMAHTEAASFHGVNTCNALYDKRAVLAAGNFADMQVAEDPDMNARLAAAGGLLARVDNPLDQRRRATWRALASQHHAYGRGAWALLQRHPAYFPAVEAWIGMGLALLLVAAAALAFVHPAALVLAAPIVLLPFYVHRRLVARFARTHGLRTDFWRRLGVLWVVYVPYHLGILHARVSGSDRRPQGGPP